MENNSIILTSGAGIASSVIMQGAVSPSLDMSQWASAITQLAIAVITVIQLLKKRIINFKNLILCLKLNGVQLW